MIHVKTRIDIWLCMAHQCSHLLVQEGESCFIDAEIQKSDRDVNPVASPADVDSNCTTSGQLCRASH